MMNKKGMLVICGNSVAELEQELKMLKMAVSTGAMMGCGGSTIGDVEQALNALSSVVGGVPSTADECNCVSCGGNCDCCCGCDEEIEYCPNCGDILDEWGDCENCGYPDADLMESEERSPYEEEDCDPKEVDYDDPDPYDRDEMRVDEPTLDMYEMLKGQNPIDILTTLLTLLSDV